MKYLWIVPLGLILAMPESAIAQHIAFVPNSFTYKVTERNDSWWRIAWKVEIHNLTTNQARVFLSIQWKDADGFELGTDIGECNISPSDRTTCTGSDLIDVQVASRVATASITGQW